MNRFNCTFAALLFSTFACAAENDASPETTDGMGSLALNLTATDANGETYRLRNAQFGISGYSYATGEYIWTNKTVSTETDPEAPVITERLLAGDYSVSFVTGSGWYMEHLTATGPELVEKSAFLGPASQWVYVYRGTTTAASFRFGVNGELVDFFGGDLQIGITVEEPTGTGGVSGGGGSAGLGGAVEGGVGGAF